jgi:hypothetical protein
LWGRIVEPRIARIFTNRGQGTGRVPCSIHSWNLT